MHSLGDWIALSIPLYLVLTFRLQGRAAMMALWGCLWAMAGAQAVNTYVFHQQWLAFASYMRNADASLLPGKTAQHYQLLWMDMIEVFVLLLLPIIFYWFDSRKQHRATLSARTV